MADPVDPDHFREDFPEFASIVTYPTTMVQFWLDVASQMVRQQVWGQQYKLGVELYTAHNLVLEAQAARAVAVGGVPGVSSGPINNKSVDKVSTGYDTTVASEEKAGAWNLTVYGTRFYRLMLMFGAGGIQLGAGCGIAGTVNYNI
jgi:hypothetical protein